MINEISFDSLPRGVQNSIINAFKNRGYNLSIFASCHFVKITPKHSSQPIYYIDTMFNWLDKPLFRFIVAKGYTFRNDYVLEYTCNYYTRKEGK